MKKTTIAFLLFVFLVLPPLIYYVIAPLLVTVPIIGEIHTPAEIIANPPSIDYGTFIIDEANPTWNIGNTTVDLTNNGDLATQPLDMSVTWITPTTSLGTVTWNGTDTIIAGHSTVTVWIALTIDPATTYTGTFNFDLFISEQT